ncbi:MAG TPA: hypothetical protein PLV68_17440 [Ilumatobacteraceae bacterium]|nr:hypothetical protein [Ilumatobacteraceae bacterium]
MVRYATDPVVTAVIATLTTVGLKVGDGIAPAGVGWGAGASGAAGVDVFQAYAVVHLFRVEHDGSLVDPFDDGAPVISVSAYADTASHARRVGDIAHSALVDGVVTVTGRSVMLVAPLDDASTDRLDDVQPPIWQDVRRYRISTTA